MLLLSRPCRIDARILCYPMHWIQEQPGENDISRYSCYCDPQRYRESQIERERERESYD